MVDVELSNVQFKYSVHTFINKCCIKMKCFELYSNNVYKTLTSIPSNCTNMQGILESQINNIMKYIHQLEMHYERQIENSLKRI